MFSWFAALVFNALPAASPAPTPAPHCIQLVSTTDVHGHLEPEEHHAGAFSVAQGGLPGFAGYLDIVRAKYRGQVLLLDSGDLFQGTVPSNLSKGAAVVVAYNAMHYDAAALGNHEFDYGPEGTEKDLLGALKKRFEEAHFPFLAANVYEAATHQRVKWPNFAASHLFSWAGSR